MPSTPVSADVLEALTEFDTPTITNVVATYPAHPLCLGLYHPWNENWYTDETIRCMYPEMRPVVGYAVTCTFGMPDPDYKRDVGDMLKALDASPKPSILVFEQKLPPEILRKCGLFGEVVTTSLKAVGCVGGLSNGPSRDIEAIRGQDFQYLLSGVTAGHGDVALQAVNVPVTIGGMDVAPGELIHMDAHGACKFPADKAELLARNAKQFVADEETLMAKMRAASGDVAGVLKAMGESQYGDYMPDDE